MTDEDYHYFPSAPTSTSTSTSESEYETTDEHYYDEASTGAMDIYSGTGMSSSQHEEPFDYNNNNNNSNSNNNDDHDYYGDDSFHYSNSQTSNNYEASSSSALSPSLSSSRKRPLSLNPKQDATKRVQCPSCGGTDFDKDEGSELLICTQCYTQIKAHSGASQNELEIFLSLTAKTKSGRMKGRRLPKKLRTNGEKVIDEEAKYKNRVDLPSVELCLEAFQFILVRLCEIMVEEEDLLGSDVGATSAVDVNDLCKGGDDDAIARRLGNLEFSKKRLSQIVVKTCGNIWMTYLREWHKAANYYSAKFSNLRISMLDHFLDFWAALLLRRRIGMECEEKTHEKEKKEELATCHSKEHNGICTYPQGRFDEKETKDRHKIFNKNILNIRHLWNYLNNTKGDEQLTKREAAIRLYPSNLFLMAALHNTLLRLNFGVSAGTICEWVASGRLPILNTFSLLPEMYQSKLVCIRSFFQMVTKDFPDSTAIEYMSELLSIVTMGNDELCKSRLFRLRNVPLMLARLAKDVGLNQKVVDFSFALMGCHDSISDKQLAVPPSLILASSPNLRHDYEIAAVLIVAIRLIPEWEMMVHKLTHKSFTKVHHENRFWIPYNSAELGNVLNGHSSSRYIDFINKYFTLRNAEEEEMFNVMINIKQYRYDDENALTDVYDWLRGDDVPNMIVEESSTHSSIKESDMEGDDDNVTSARKKSLLSGSNPAEVSSHSVGKYFVYNDCPIGVKKVRKGKGQVKYEKEYSGSIYTGSRYRYKMMHNPRTMHHHYIRLIEFFADKVGCEALDLHKKVWYMDRELLDATQSSVKNPKKSFLTANN